MLAQGVGPAEVAAQGVIGKTALWQLRYGDRPEDLNFQKDLEDLQQKIATEATEDVVGKAVEELRRLAPEAIQAFRDGLAADTRYVAGAEGMVVALPDRSLAVRTADLVTKRIAELVPQQKNAVEHTGSIEHLIAELDARADG